MEQIVFIDSEISIKDKKPLDFGGIKSTGEELHSSVQFDFYNFLRFSKFICGHNIIHHDLKYLSSLMPSQLEASYIDTLYLSPLLFPQHPYHNLVKDDKLQTDSLNNPFNDSIKARDLFYDEVESFNKLPDRLKGIYATLLFNIPEFSGFFKYLKQKPKLFLASLIRQEFKNEICDNVNIDSLIKEHPIELAYSLSLVNIKDRVSLTPPWVLRNYPYTENVIKLLTGTRCKNGCPYCNTNQNPLNALKRYFGYSEFRKFDDEPLQENAINAAINNKSLIAIFPTGGGKSLTFQIPALMSGENSRSLTVVISPLQSLMKDQVDNLSSKGITDAVTINGLLNNVERKEAIDRVMNGIASILYISPELLRSKTVEKMLLCRTISRIVIDEAHCFSAWGQDFRVDYLYIGKFIKRLQEIKKLSEPIPISCFTATAKQKVITDIKEYFSKNLGLELELFATSATRKNLHYTVLFQEDEAQKYTTLRRLITNKKCPTIVYVSTVRKTDEIANKLSYDGIPALPYNGKMDPKEKIKNQEEFISNNVSVMVATSAFGMGVDKKDVGLVIHYNISDSLENYVQEAGRAGRDETISAECYVLFNNDDLDKHFVMLNQTKLSISEIQQVWKGIKGLSKNRQTFVCSALEIARKAGWNDQKQDIETRVKTAINALEEAGYVKRGINVPKVFADSLLVKSMAEASNLISKINTFSEKDVILAKRVVKHLITTKSINEAQGELAEARVDYIADILGYEKEEVIYIINELKRFNVISDTKDMIAYIPKENNSLKSNQVLNKYLSIEEFVIGKINTTGITINLKQLNAELTENGIKSSLKEIKTIINFLTVKGYIKKPGIISQNDLLIQANYNLKEMISKLSLRSNLCKFIVDNLSRRVYMEEIKIDEDTIKIPFSIVELYNKYISSKNMYQSYKTATPHDFEEAILYLVKTEAMDLQGGFLVIYNGMEINRLVLDNKIRYKNEDYKSLSEYYKNKIQQIHIVGKYANLMVKDYSLALQFVSDYFQLDYRAFISKYYKDEEYKEINRNITPQSYNRLYKGLSKIQKEIIDDSTSKRIVVAAGPGSGKTRLLVYKLASLLQLEDVKSEQLLMLTFSRSAATEFKTRLIDLIKTTANYVDIKTFHSYCFDLLGKVGNIEESKQIVEKATQMILNGEVENEKITKTVLVIDEAQDMDENEYELVKALIEKNDDLRLIAVGDDDQNIYEFRGSSSKHLKDLISSGSKKYEMVENYRSKKKIVEFSNIFVKSISNRMKTNPIVAVSNEDGEVRLIKHYSSHLEIPIVNEVLYSKDSGTTCILTYTNEEAMNIYSILTKQKVKSKLIQSLEGFPLTNLKEMLFFLGEIDKKVTTPIIDDETWNICLNSLQKKFKSSDCLSGSLNLLEAFSKINKKKYRSDLEEFIFESKYDDFLFDEKDAIYISTIHKAKGREFDNVYMILDYKANYTDEEKRAIYVGMTRAKSKLVIHYSGNLFKNISNIFKITYDNKEYGEPDEIMVQLTHRDVVLSFFEHNQNLINILQSGYTLTEEGEYLKLENSIYNVLKYSKSFIEKRKHIEELGYVFSEAKIQFIVLWQNKENNKSSYIVLPKMTFIKEKKQND